MPVFERTLEIPLSVEKVFAYHTRPGAFQRMTPPWEDVRVLHHEGGIQDGAQVTLELRKSGIPIKWHLEHVDYLENQQFVDVQKSGPFKSWRHEHLFEEVADGRCKLIDRITYELPAKALDAFAAPFFVGPQLERMFVWRHQRLLDDLTLLSRFDGKAPLKVAVTGASGLIGSALVAVLHVGGHDVTRLVRHRPVGEGEIYWNVAKQEIDTEALEGFDAVVHLAGENVIGRWTEAKKQAIMDSRRGGTTQLCEALAKLKKKPKVLVSASAMGYYGGRSDDAEVTEASEAGDTFLADVCKVWEAAADPARAAGIRVMHPRISIVLSGAGGALDKMQTPFKMGVGGNLGDGQHWMPWMGIQDVVGAILTALYDDRYEGPVNFCTPQTVRNEAFTKALGDALNRPTFLHVPKAALTTLLGDMADEMLLMGMKLVPAKLQEWGYEFIYDELREALKFELGKLEEPRVPVTPHEQEIVRKL